MIEDNCFVLINGHVIKADPEYVKIFFEELENSMVEKQFSRSVDDE